MNAVDTVLPRLKIEEGFRSRAYKDTRGRTTIGYGFNVDAGITQHAAEGLLAAQLEELHEALSVHSWYEGLDPARQSVCLDIAFNDGLAGFTEGFPEMIAAITAQDWPRAAQECHVQNPELAGRYERLAQIIATGSNA